MNLACCFQVLAIAFVRNGKQAFIKPALISAAFVTRDQQDGLSLGVECKSQSPNLVAPVKTQLFHVTMMRALQGIDGGTS
jgi:hypothetical protein